MTDDVNLQIAELESALRELKRIRKIDRMSAARKAALADPAVRAKMSAASKAALADPAVRAKMSAASKAAWDKKYEAELAPKRKRESRTGLGEIPRDPFEARLFGGKRR